MSEDYEITDNFAKKGKKVDAKSWAIREIRDHSLPEVYSDGSVAWKSHDRPAGTAASRPLSSNSIAKNGVKTLVEVDNVIYCFEIPGFESVKLSMDNFPYEGLMLFKKKTNFRASSEIIKFDSTTKRASLGDTSLKCKAGEDHSSLLDRLQSKQQERVNSSVHIAENQKKKKSVHAADGSLLQVILTKHARERALQRNIAWADVFDNIRYILPSMKYHYNTEPFRIVRNVSVVLRKLSEKKMLIITLYYDGNVRGEDHDQMLWQEKTEGLPDVDDWYYFDDDGNGHMYQLSAEGQQACLVEEVRLKLASIEEEFSHSDW